MKRTGPLIFFSLMALSCPAAYATDTPLLTSPQLAQIYSTIEDSYRAEGKFRGDYQPADAPFDADTLTQNFAHIAQRSETHIVRGEMIAEGSAKPLVRWETPINLWTLGATDTDKRHLDTLSKRITELTDLPVSRTRDTQLANIYILVADAERRRDLGALIATLGHAENAPLGEIWPEQVKFPCIARVAIDPVSHTLKWAMILIKDELKGAFRRSCFTEELVQSLGLFNDGANIRPSIFNDDAEFIELTRHDEYLLKILYDQRLRPGMSRQSAEPIVREIATKLLADAKTF